VHLGHHVVMEGAGHVLEEGVSVDVHRGGVEGVLIGPRACINVGRRDVHSLHGVVEVREIDVGVRSVHGLELQLCDQEFMLGLYEMIAFIRVEVHVGTEHLGSCIGSKVGTALDPDFHGVVLKRDQGKGFGPVFAEKEGNHEIIRTSAGGVAGLGVVADFSGRDGARGLGGVILVQDVVHTLDEERVQLAHLLTTDHEGKLGGIGLSRRVETVSVGEHVGNVGCLDPHVAEEVTLGANGNRDFVTSPEGADVVHALGLYGEVRVSFVVLTEE